MPRARLAAFIMLGSLLLSGCGLIDWFFLPPPEDTAQELYEAGQDAMHDKKYSQAAEYFTKLKDRYPFSPYTPRAELALADAYFLNEEYLLASDAYKEYEELHPAAEETPYVLYQVGVSNYRLFKSVDMPMGMVSEALEYFYRVEESYPGSKYSEASKDYVTRCRRLQADHELFIADFFWRTERYGSAWKRYQYVVDNFQDLSKVALYAQKRAEYSYYEYQKSISSVERAQIYGSWKQWFDWL
ncbi:MAG: outer membrane protein assembly factor BamD [Desulfovibrionaceae bacterium]